MAKRKLKIDLNKGIKKLEIATKTASSSILLGTYKSAFKGRGLEFAGYREYSLNDDASLIDWKATLRSNKLLIKEYQEERSLDVFFLIDASNSMIFTSTDKLKIEYAAELAASLTFTMLEAGDGVGFALFNEKVTHKFKPIQGKHQFFTLAKVLVDPNNYGGKYDLATALKFTLSFLSPGTLVIIISDFIGLHKNWEHYLKVASWKFDVIAIKLNDIRDLKLPAESFKVMVTDPYSSGTKIIDPLYAKTQYEYYVKSQNQFLQKLFLKLNIDFLQLTTDKPFVKPLMTFFSRRHGKWR